MKPAASPALQAAQGPRIPAAGGGLRQALRHITYGLEHVLAMLLRTTGYVSHEAALARRGTSPPRPTGAGMMFLTRLPVPAGTDHHPTYLMRSTVVRAWPR